MTETDKLAVRDAKRAKRNAKREVKRAKKQRYIEKKQRDLQSRTALSQRNIVEFAMEQCKKIKDRNRSLRSTALKTSKETLATVAYVPPKLTKE
jgi:hypothetical protein